MTKTDQIIIIAWSVIIGAVLGALIGYWSYQLVHLRTIIRIETLEKTCRYMHED